MKIVVVSGGFDPIHSGHLAYFREAKELGMYLIVGLIKRTPKYYILDVLYLKPSSLTTMFISRGIN